VWTLIVLRPNHKSPFPFANPRRTSRIPKMLPHRLFPDAKYTIWIDGNKRHNGTMDDFLNKTLCQGAYAMGFPDHRRRPSSSGESEATGRWRLEHPRPIKVQDIVYELGYKEFHTDGILWAGVIVRDNTELRTHWQSCLWFNDWARYSQRDQVSLIQTLKWSDLHNNTHEFPRQWVREISHAKRHGE